MTWNDQKPSASDPLSELPSVLTGQAVAFRQALEKHFFWTQGSGASAGIPALTDNSNVTGSARAYFGPQSQVSAASASGKLMVTSDTQRLFGLGTTTSWLLGSARALVSAGTSDATIASNARWLVQSGTTTGIVGGGTTYRQDFSTAYSASPIILLQTTTSQATAFYSAVVTARATSGFSFKVGNLAPQSSNSCTVMWMSAGTVIL